MSADLLFEIGTEEIPAGYLANAIVAMQAQCEQSLRDAGLGCAHIRAMGTPRRLSLLVGEVASKQVDVVEEMVGPPAHVAFDAEGKATKAAQAFAARNGLPLDELRQGPVDGKSGDYLLCTRRQAGKPATELLPLLLGNLVEKLPWPKSMRWSAGETSFARPIHWIVCMLGGKLLPFAFAGIAAGTKTFGHRFMAPDEIELRGKSDEYTERLRQAFVLVDPEVRRQTVVSEIRRMEEQCGIVVRSDEELIDEVANLLEYPVGVCGEFSTEYLELPEQVIVSAMRNHQRYFAANQPDGALQNRFVTIAGTRSRDMDTVRKGNERVLAARLADARFFFREDQKSSLDAFSEKLGRVVFQKKLGSIADKVERISAGAVSLASDVGVAPDWALRATRLCKADLTTQMVGEFPDLQGIMGRRYATIAGEPNQISVAIEEHYLPRGASDILPESELATVIGVADRMDTIAGCFAIGVVPTGSADPFGLRRAALGVLRLLTARDWTVLLPLLVSRAVSTVVTQQKIDAEVSRVEEQILEFLRIRFRGLLLDGHSLPGDCIDAAFATGFHDPRDARLRAEALSQLRGQDHFQSLVSTVKRVANILKGQSPPGEPKSEIFVVDQERCLWSAYEEIRSRVDAAFAAHEYVLAITILGELKDPVESFFDAVLVMDQDEKIRANRLTLLARINDAFTKTADFRQLAV